MIQSFYGKTIRNNQQTFLKIEFNWKIIFVRITFNKGEKISIGRLQGLSKKYPTFRQEKYSYSVNENFLIEKLLFLLPDIFFFIRHLSLIIDATFLVKRSFLIIIISYTPWYKMQVFNAKIISDI